MTDSHQLGNKWACHFLISANGLPGIEEDLLGQVLGVRFIASPVINVSVDPVNMHVVQPSESIGIMTNSFLHQHSLI